MSPRRFSIAVAVLCGAFVSIGCSEIIGLGEPPSIGDGSADSGFGDATVVPGTAPDAQADRTDDSTADDGTGSEGDAGPRAENADADAGAVVGAEAGEAESGDNGDAGDGGLADGEGGACTPGELACEGGCVPNGAQHCGSCGNDCTALAHVSGPTTCVAGMCSFAATACAVGWADCNGRPDDGCETDVTQPAHCGGCNVQCSGATPVCSASGTNQSCVSGCSMATPMACGDGGTCVDPSGDTNNCGTCGHACTTAIGNAQPACDAGACSFVCNAGYIACGDACVDEQTDDAHCGGCTISCAGGKTCQSGVCACPSGTHDCSGVCESNASVDNCGSQCNTPCPGPANGATYGSAACDGTSCTLSCAPGLNDCGGACVDEGNDKNNCGACRTTCISCLSGRCVKPVSLATGYGHTCALLSDGTVECWGDDAWGELGQGSYVASSPTPVLVQGLAGTVTAIASSSAHVCALLANGTVQCWGNNAHGQLGRGTGTGSSPTPMAVSGLANAIAISASADTTCAVVSSGSVYCWGWNGSGQLGNGSTTAPDACTSGDPCAMTPALIPNVSGAISVTSGFGHDCALLSNGTVQCWGGNTYGQVGIGSTTNPIETPATVVNLTGVAAISAGHGDHTCALLSGGTVQCWGYNANGQLGNGTTTTSDQPVQVSGLSGATAIGVGANHSCAVLSTGAVQCWGLNANGELGNGTNADSPTPVTVLNASRATGSSLPLNGAIGVRGGYSHSCALLAGGGVECWGLNSSAQLGNGTTTDSTTAVAVTW